MIESALLELVHAMNVPFARTEGSAKHDLPDGHACVCHAPPTHVAVLPCMHAMSPVVQGSFVCKF